MSDKVIDLTDEHKIPKDYFKMHLTVLKIIGINILPIENSFLRALYNIYAFLFVWITYIIFLGVEFQALFDNKNDMEVVSFILGYWIVHFMGAMKCTILLINSKNIVKYLFKFETGVFLPNVNRGGMEEIKIIKTAITAANAQAKIFYGFAVFVITNRILYALFDPGHTETSYDVITNTTSVKAIRTLPWFSWFWFDTNPTPNYQLAFTYQIWCITVYGILIGTSDALITGLLVHLNAQFSILRNSVLTLRERAIRMHLQESENDKDLDYYMTVCTNDCLDHHNQIIELSQNVEDQFNKMILIQFLGSTIIFCFALFQLSFIPMTNIQKFASSSLFLGAMLFQLTIYCYNGNEVQIQSQEISKAAYSCDWVDARDEVKKSLILMMVRAQRPIKMSAGKFGYLTLETLMNIIRGSFSYYMVLRRMNGEA